MSYFSDRRAVFHRLVGVLNRRRLLQRLVVVDARVVIVDIVGVIEGVDGVLGVTSARLVSVQRRAAVRVGVEVNVGALDLQNSYGQCERKVK